MQLVNLGNMKVTIIISDEAEFETKVTRRYSFDMDSQPNWNEVIEDMTDTIEKSAKI